MKLGDNDLVKTVLIQAQKTVPETLFCDSGQWTRAE